MQTPRESPDGSIPTQSWLDKPVIAAYSSATFANQSSGASGESVCPCVGTTLRRPCRPLGWPAEGVRYCRSVLVPMVVAWSCRHALVRDEWAGRTLDCGSL